MGESGTLSRMEILGSPTFVLFVVLFAGLVFGNLSIKGISLGSSGVLFAALAAGHFGLQVPEGIADVGTAIFVYCVGLGVGNRFFDSLKSRGKYLMILAILVVGVAWLTAWVLGRILDMDAGTVAGLFAGACTSTPALAAVPVLVPDGKAGIKGRYFTVFLHSCIPPASMYVSRTLEIMHSTWPIHILHRILFFSYVSYFAT